jgi:hypothetical protein
MLYVIGLYHYPPSPVDNEERPMFIWVLLAGPFKKRDTALFALDLERSQPALQVSGRTYHAVYRMIVREAQLEWYGLSPNSPSVGQTTFDEGGLG